MTFIEWALLAILSLAAVLMSYGCWLIYSPAGYIVGGLLLAVIAILFMASTGGPS